MEDNQRETALQSFIDKIPDLKPVRRGSKELIILKARTLTLLPILDANRKGIVLKFLYELGFVCIDNEQHKKPVLQLDLADLSGANLIGFTLSMADLSNTNLSNADLVGTDLSGANLSGANVTDEQLSKAKSLKAATMPDGSIHP